jgi:hypothetical protein
MLEVADVPVSITPPARGVYTLDFYNAAGDFIAVAIGTDGKCVAWLPYKAESEDQVYATLNHLLDVADPEARLRVV